MADRPTVQMSRAELEKALQAVESDPHERATVTMVPLARPGDSGETTARRVLPGSSAEDRVTPREGVPIVRSPDDEDTAKERPGAALGHRLPRAASERPLRATRAASEPPVRPARAGTEPIRRASRPRAEMPALRPARIATEIPILRRPRKVRRAFVLGLACALVALGAFALLERQPEAGAAPSRVEAASPTTVR